MRQKRQYSVITFFTTTEAMAFEAFCTAQGLPGRVIPTPQAISAGCGLAWRVEPQQQAAVLQAAAQAGLHWQKATLLVL